MLVLNVKFIYNCVFIENKNNINIYFVDDYCEIFFLRFLIHSILTYKFDNKEVKLINNILVARNSFDSKDHVKKKINSHI